MKIKFSSLDRLIVKGHTIPLHDISQITVSGHSVEIVTAADDNLIYVSKSISEFFEVSANGTDIVGQKIYVQIKNKSGIDTGDTEGLEQLKQRTLNEPGAVKILLSTADKFTEECKKIALENNILLIDSDGFLNLVFKYTD